jgi:hypothetical protein
MRFRNFGFASVFALATACGGVVTTPGDAGADAGQDAPQQDANPTVQCNGYCPKPNGSQCSSDCDCYQKCLNGTDKPPSCGDALAPTITCTGAADCPGGQTCGAFGECQGASCGTSDDCPAHQDCQAGACVVVGCI